MEIKRIAHNAANPALRGKPVQIVGYQAATHWDSSRIKVRPIEQDGSLGEEWLVTAGILISL